MKLEETENLKLQYVNNIQTITSQINNIHDSDTELAKKIQILNINAQNPNFQVKPSFKKWCNYRRRYGHNIVECRQKQQDNQIKPQKHREANKSFYQNMKKESQNLPKKTLTVTTFQANNFLTIIMSLDNNQLSDEKLSRKISRSKKITKLLKK